MLNAGMQDLTPERDTARIQDQQQLILQRMTPEKKLHIAICLYDAARSLKGAGLRAFHPDWAEEQIREKVREIFLYANT
jgi:hypothetical protein